MTFVCNVLHHEYSLLAADRLANADGPTTIKVGNVTIHAQKGAKIDGFRKMRISKCGTVAIGVAGSINEHNYFNNIENTEGVEESIKGILDSVQDFFLSPEREGNLSKTEAMQNEGVATFYDGAASRYFSLLYIYTHFESAARWFAVSAGGARLVHIGTGSSQFEKTVGLDEINRFIDLIKSNPDPGVCIDWLKEAYEKVSVTAQGVGKEPEFLISTRSEPAFKKYE